MTDNLPLIPVRMLNKTGQLNTTKTTWIPAFAGMTNINPES